MKYFIAVAIFVLGLYLGRVTVPDPQSVPEANIRNLESEITKPKVEQEKTQLASKPGEPRPSEIPKNIEVTDERSQPLPPESSPLQINPLPNIQIKKWNTAEKGIPQIHTQSEVAQFLERVKIENFATELSGAKPFNKSDEALEFLNGSFVGSMSPQDSTQGFMIFLKASIQVQNQELKGRVSIRLSRDGTTFSRSSNNGDIKNIQRFRETSVALIITSGDYHFQLYFVPRLESFEGNCYHQYKPGSVRYVGTVHLERA